jgi:membrane protease YdiL (CAAX protease family)
MQSKNSIQAVNILFLFVLCLEAANLFFTWLPQYVRLILNEALFVFLPAYLFLRITRQPVAERVRWRWPGWKAALLSLLAGLGLYPFSALSAAVLASLLGYQNALAAPDAIPSTPLMAVLAIVALAVMASLCEEFLFRGVIQPAYETRGPRWAVLFVGFLFIIFHLSLLQGLSIIPLALMLGFVNYRTRSLPASILAHFSANVLAALVVVQNVFNTGLDKVLFTLPALLTGLVVSALSLWGLARLTRHEREAESIPAEEAHPPKRPGWLAQSWPLLIGGVIVLAFYASEVIYARSPELTAAPLKVNVPAWEAEHTWQYEVRNVLEEVVGEGECTLSAGDPLEITCYSEVKAYKVQRGNSYYESSGGRRVDSAHWSASSGQMLDGITTLDLVTGFQSVRSWTLDGQGFAIQVEDENAPEPNLNLALNETPLAGNASLLATNEYFWPWQLAGMPMEQGANGRVVIFSPFTWREKTRDNGPQARAEIVNVVEIENVDTPAGSFSAWRVDLGTRATAWYDAADPRRVVKFFNGVETWYLN